MRLINIQMKKYSILLVIKEILFKTLTRYNFPYKIIN